MNQSDKRRFDRNQLVYYLKVFYVESGELAGYLGDISPQGIMLVSKDRIPLKTKVNLCIHLDTELEMKEKLVLKANSLWQEQDVNPDYYVTGFEFMDLDQKTRDTVDYLTRKYGFVR